MLKNQKVKNENNLINDKNLKVYSIDEQKRQ